MAKIDPSKMTSVPWTTPKTKTYVSRSATYEEMVKQLPHGRMWFFLLAKSEPEFIKLKKAVMRSNSLREKIPVNAYLANNNIEIVTPESQSFFGFEYAAEAWTDVLKLYAVELGLPYATLDFPLLKVSDGRVLDASRECSIVFHNILKYVESQKPA